MSRLVSFMKQKRFNRIRLFFIVAFKMNNVKQCVESNISRFTDL